MDVKCRQCGQKVDKAIAYCHIADDGKKQYYCSEAHYNIAVKEQKKKEKEKADKDAVYQAVTNILGYKTQNTALFKEWAVWNTLKSDRVIAQYLGEKEDYLRQAISRLSGSEYCKIRYLSAVIKNGIMDFKEKNVAPVVLEQPNDDTQVMFHINKKKPVNNRCGFGELSDDK